MKGVIEIFLQGIVFLGFYSVAICLQACRIHVLIRPAQLLRGEPKSDSLLSQKLDDVLRGGTVQADTALVYRAMPQMA